MKLGKVFAWEFRRTVRSRQFLLMTILIPAFIGLVLGAILLFGGTDTNLSRASAGPTPPFLASIIIASILLIGAILNGTMVMNSVIREKTNRVVEIVLSSISSADLLAGKILGQGFAGLIQATIWGIAAGVAVTRIVPGVSWELTPVQLISYPFYFAFGYLLIAALLATLAAAMKDMQTAGPMILVIPLFYIPIWCAKPIIDAPNTLLATAVSFFPPCTPGMMLIRVSVGPVPLWEVAGTTLALVVCNLLIVRVAARAFQTAMLMYGKRATIRELWRWGVRRRS